MVGMAAPINFGTHVPQHVESHWCQRRCHIVGHDRQPRERRRQQQSTDLGRGHRDARDPRPVRRDPRDPRPVESVIRVP